MAASSRASYIPSNQKQVDITYSTKSDTALLDTTTVSIEGLFFKIVLVGDFSVGKTSFLSQYCDKTFDPNVVSTVGVDFRTIDLVRNGNQIELQLWDTAGEERYHSMTTTYYRGANGFVVLFDLTNHVSFDNCNSRWIDEIAEKCHESDYSIVIVGNKQDLHSQRMVSEEEIRELAESKDIKYFECSTKDNINVTEAVEHLLDTISKKMLVKFGSTEESAQPTETEERTSCFSC